MFKNNFIIKLLGIIVLATLILFAQNSYQVWIYKQNIPTEIKQKLVKREFSEKYDISYHINPFYLRGDFNKDNKNEIAILIEEKVTNKKGIAIFKGKRDSLFIIGAGKSFGNGGDNFSWMNIWRVGVQDNNTEYIFIEKSESASAAIVWDDTTYIWQQIGD